MGYCYSGGKLVCDSCGATGSVRKRTCRYRVTYAEGGSLPYCSPSALCAVCYTTHKPTLHANCKAGAVRRTAEETERRQKLDAGELEVRTAWGDWHELVPAGYVGVRFIGMNGSEVYRLILAGEYHGRGYLSEYPNLSAWEPHA